MATKVPLALLSGLLCDRGIWEPQIAALAGVATIHVPDFSRLDTIEGMAREVLAQVPGEFAAAGHSMGGRVALEILRLAPERVSWRGFVEHRIYATSTRRRAAETSPVGSGAQRGFGCIGVTLDSTSPVGHESAPRRCAAGLSRNRSPIERDDIREPYTSIAREAGCVRSTAADPLSRVGRLRTAGRAERTRRARAHGVRHPWEPARGYR